MTLDFGAGAFNGDARWLEIGVRTNGIGAFTELTPRQEVPLMPYALYAAEAGGAAATNVAGLGSSAFQDTNFFDPAGAGTAAAQAATNNFGNTVAATLTNAANQVAGTFAGNGAGVTNLNAQDFTNASRLGLIEIPNPTPAANDYFGWCVAGVGTNQFVIGAYKTIGGNRVGQAYLYDTTGTLLATITNPVPAAGDYFGWFVAGVGTNQFVIGADGKTIGGIAGVGQAYLYDTTGTLLAIITNPAPATGDYFGYSVAGVGTNQFVIGAYNKTIGGIAGVGQAYLYDTTGTLLATITNPAPAAND